jgi:hypothetical protein
MPRLVYFYSATSRRSRGAMWSIFTPALITKFARMPGYSKYHSGHISLQGTEPKGEPGVKLWFRSIKIKRL